jgi:hypothetical protein
MRKLLLATAAIIGATSGLAMAQTMASGPGHPDEGQWIAPRVGGPSANNNNNSWGVANTASGDAAISPNTRIFPPNTNAVPTPGNIVIRLNGKIEADFVASFTSLDHVGSAKLNPVMIGSYMRLYPGFDGMAANGLRYGASIELRENFNNANATGNTTPSGSGSGNTSTQTVFVRRSFTYLANDQFGIVRLGVSDGVQGLMDNGVFTSQNWDAGVGNFNGGTNQALMPGNAQVPFVWLSQAGAEYGSNKIVYLSPQFFGFDFGVDYAPNPGNGFQINGTTCAAANANCVNVASGGDLSKWLNKVTVGARYQGVFGAIDVKAYGTYTTAGKQGGTGVVGGATAAAKYDNLSFINAGAAVSSMGFTVAADWVGGAVNSLSQYGMRPSGGVSMSATVAGVTYVNGPLTLGAEVGLIDGQGATQLVGKSQRHEFEVAFGGNYAVAPGLAIVGEYLYEQRHQGGFDFASGTAGALTRDVKGQAFLLGTVLSW